MIYRHLRNVKGFFSDYYLGSVFGQGSGRRRRLSDRDTEAAYRRFQRIYQAAEGRADDAAACRERFIRPLVRDVLGYHLGAGEERIHGLYASAEAEAAGEAPLVLCYAGAWDEDLDTGRGAEVPLKRLHKAMAASRQDHAFLITGERMRLVRPAGEGPAGSYLEVDLASLAADEDPESFAAFYRLFHASLYRPDDDGILPIDRIEAESRRHAEQVSDDLKRVVFTSAETLVAALINDARRRAPEEDPPAIDEEALRQYRDAALLAIYRMLFILYAEARDERLQQHTLYRESYSLHGLVEELLYRPPVNWPSNRASLWARLKVLFQIYDEGLPRIDRWEDIPPRGSDFFDPGTPAGSILEQAELPDREVAQLVFDLTTTRPRRGVGRERISFRELDIENLGAVYEGLLEYEPRLAAGTLIELRIQGRSYVLSPAEVVRLCREKNLGVKGDPALVAGTEAEALHPAYAEEDEPDGADAASADGSDGEEGTAEAVKKGAPARLLRRFEAGDFYFVPGAARKGSGSFYTPLPLVRDLVRHALGLLAEGKTVAEIESLRVLDAACGSAHFLVEAMRYLGRELHRAYVKEYKGKRPPQKSRGGWDDNWRASDEQARAANSAARAWCKRRIAERCLFGVDLNPTAVQLARVALWIESLAGDRPLSYFEHHVRCGNSILGSWLARITEPPLPTLAARRGAGAPQGDLFGGVLEQAVNQAATARRLIDQAETEALRREGIEPETVAAQAMKDTQRRKAETLLAAARLLFDLRSAAAFVPAIWPEWSTLYSLVNDHDQLLAYAQSRPWWPAFEVVRCRERFFHWELEFPEVFLDPDKRGFDAILGNPPWDKVLPNRHEFYGRYDILIRAYTGAELDSRIKELNSLHPNLAEEFQRYRDRINLIAAILKKGGDYSYHEWEIDGRTSGGHQDLFKFFVERAHQLLREGGRAGYVVPSALYNNEGCTGLRHLLLDEAAIERFYAFENRDKIFPIDSRYKFVSLVFRKGAPDPDGFQAAFMRHDLEELSDDAPKEWMVPIKRDELVRLSPGTLAFLEYRGPRDREILLEMYQGRPLLGDEGPDTWNARFYTEFNMTNDKDLWTDPATGRLWTVKQILGTGPADFQETRARMAEKGFWPLYEGKHIEQFLVDIKPIERWVSLEACEAKYGKPPEPGPKVVFRDIAANTNERTCIAAVLPARSCFGHTLSGLDVSIPPDEAVTVLNSFVFDFGIRFRTAGTHLSFTYMSRMPLIRLPVSVTVPTGSGGQHHSDSHDTWQFVWAGNRAVAEAYGLTPDDFAHVLSTFPVFARKRPEFFAYLQERLAEWKAEGGRSPSQKIQSYAQDAPPNELPKVAEPDGPIDWTGNDAER
ncbi:MAG TPA: SAM-dependent DNA methyltransferase [Gammaproteobacteria bacterium]|nr:SAM-dependent DNA methyltransferase [Gammaproteobacteria bacterium]